MTHKGCLDGTGSALMFIWAGGRRDNILFRSPSECAVTPAELPMETQEVWFADCCPPDLSDPAAGRPFLVFDHHVSNERKFSGDPRCTFDGECSGTSLLARELGTINDEDTTWMEGRRRLVRALEAYDLGRFDYRDGQYLADLAATYSQDDMLSLLERLDSLVFDDIEEWGRAKGAAAVRHLGAQSVARSARMTTLDFTSMPDGMKWRMGVAACPVFWKNEAAELILDQGADIAVLVDLAGGMASLRSRAGGPDVSQIAALYGGGGHARAAGFKIDRNNLLRLTTEDIFG